MQALDTEKEDTAARAEGVIMEGVTCQHRSGVCCCYPPQSVVF